MIRDIQHGMNVLMPLDYPRAETGSTCNHDVHFRAQFTARDDYIRSMLEPIRDRLSHYTDLSICGSCRPSRLSLQDL